MNNEIPGNAYIVYQDLNDATNVFVARADEVVTGTFRMVAGPFEKLSEAERAVERTRKQKK